MFSNSHAFRESTFRTSDGLSLYYRTYDAEGDGQGLPVICLAGLSRNSRDFHDIATMIASQPEKPRRVIAMDYRGRGKSDWDPKPENYNVLTEARDVVALMDHLGMAGAIFIGTSRGGLILHIMAAFAPDRIAGIVLNDIGPEIELAGMRQIRDYLSAWPEPRNWAQAARALKATHGHGFPAFEAGDWDSMARAIFAEKQGRIVPDYDPALVEPLKTMDLEAPLPDLWPQFDTLSAIPLLAIRGEHSIVLSERTLNEMVLRHPLLIKAMAPGQAHAPVLHRHGMKEVVLDFLQRLD
jgi:pimeloyl-ACP methyl ester carboxylesterase